MLILSKLLLIIFWFYLCIWKTVWMSRVRILARGNSTIHMQGGLRGSRSHCNTVYTVLIMSSVGCKSKKEKIMTKTKVRKTFYLEKNLLEVQHRESVRSVVYVNHVYWASLKAGGYQRELWEYKTSWCFDKLSSSFQFSFSNGNSKKHEEKKKCFSYTQYKGIICRLQTLK